MLYIEMAFADKNSTNRKDEVPQQRLKRMLFW